MPDFRDYAAQKWRVSDKERRMVPFILNPPQMVIWAVMKRQMDAGLPIRIRILKARQQGVSLFSQNFSLWWVINKPSHQVLSIANRLDLPAQWVRQLKRLLQQLEKNSRYAPKASASNRTELYFGDLAGSRYLIGSSLGETPGMGDTLNGIHCSEIASWTNPDAILSDLLPALPPTANTFIIQESTGRSLGDWWYQRYYEGKDPECEYDSVFLPWYLSPEYNRDVLDEREGDDKYTWDDLGELDADELTTLAYAERYQKAIEPFYAMPDLTPGQMIWRRIKLRDDFHGDKALFANQFPACETEAFLSGGVNIFHTDQVRVARDTVRPCVKTYDIAFAKKLADDGAGGFVKGEYESYHPRSLRLTLNDSGEFQVWEDPDSRYHYVIGADCQWGPGVLSDFDVLYVQCLETGKICAKVQGRYDLMLWGKIIAAIGFRYNNALVAPERNAQAANSVMPLLRGITADWRYPNIYVRSDKVSMRGRRPQDYGWLTNVHTKPEMIAFAKTATMDGEFDWCDAEAVDQMEAYIRNDRMKLSAPQGAHDDCLMARMITGYVSHLVIPMTDLYIERDKKIVVYSGTPPADKARWMAERNDPDYEELDVEELGDVNQVECDYDYRRTGT